jgi:hypothetical protein
MAILLVALAACRDDGGQARGADEESLGLRVFQAPAGVVRAVPPHRIQPNGIGPYRLGAEFKAILSTLPHGPRVEVIQIDRVVGYRLVRVAGDAILVGIGPGGKASMVAALDPEIAKTEDGWGVGSEIDTLREALGPERTIAGARDPDLVELARLPNARVVVRGHRVAAIVVGPEGADDRPDLGPADALSGGATSRPASGAGRPRAPAPPPPDSGCTVASALEALASEPVVATARARESRKAAVYYGCFTGEDAEAVVADEDQLVLVTGEPGKLRKGATMSVPGLVFAGVSDVDGDGHHDLIAVSESRSGETLGMRIEVVRADGGRLVSTADEEVYRVTSDAAVPVAKLKDIELLIEARVDGDALEVGGYFLQWDGDEVRSIAPLAPRTIGLGSRRRSGGPSSGGSSGGESVRDDGDEGAAASSTRNAVRPRSLKPAAPRRGSDADRR